MADSFQVQLSADKLRELSASDVFANTWEATKPRFFKKQNQQFLSASFVSSMLHSFLCAHQPLLLWTLGCPWHFVVHSKLLLNI